MRLDDARARIRQHSELNAFISISEEHGEGTVVAVKDLIDVKGMITTAGGAILPMTPAAQDAPVVMRIREAGCVVVGKANLHEFAYGVTSVNPHYGPVRNPHDPTRVAGGSSGGSAVAVAAGMSDWAIGTDTGGSIRIPASYCGVAGFKPEFGSIDIGGVIPLAHSLDTLGPLAPDVESTARAYSMMSGEPISLEAVVRPRLGVPKDWVLGLDEETGHAWARVADGIPEVDFVGRKELFQVGLTILLVEAYEYHRRWMSESPEKYGADVLALLKRGSTVPASEYQSALQERPKLQAAARAAMGGIDALVLPASAIVAPRVEDADHPREAISRFTRPFNTTHQPVAVLPAPAQGLPVGIQVVGRTNGETLRAASWLEREWRELGP
jgi:aspartyl-tRNA(Asn)/glutamyl-tRNA(Gln) amidotransferase subunit A